MFRALRSASAIGVSLVRTACTSSRALPQHYAVRQVASVNRFSLVATQRFYAQDVKGQTPQEIEARVLKVCKEFDKLASNADKVTASASFVKDLGLDSLDRIELMMAFEDEFGFEIPEAEAEKLQTPGDIVKYIVNKK